MNLMIFFLFIIASCFCTACTRVYVPLGPQNSSDSANHSAYAKHLIETGALIIDARSKEEFQEDHLPGAINVPHNEVANYSDTIGTDRERTIVVYCKSGRRAGALSDALKQFGYTNVVNGGGLDDLK